MGSGSTDPIQREMVLLCGANLKNEPCRFANLAMGVED